MPHAFPSLPYDYSSLEPHIDTQTMEIHHSKHHQAYLDKFNGALEKHPELFEKTVEELLSNLDQIPEDIRTAVQNHGGGYYHHSFFWEILSPDGGGEPKGKLSTKINEKYGNIENFKEEFGNSAKTHFASGWTWLSLDKNQGLTIHSTSNQDSPLSQGLIPIIGLDVWEHAYYLKYQNRRAEYVDNWWKVINWDQAEKNLLANQ